MGHLGLFWARFWALRVAFWNPLTLYAHQLINASTLQPVARQHFETRAGGLRAERLNLPSCERKAAQSNIFLSSNIFYVLFRVLLYFHTFVTYLFVVFVQQRDVHENVVKPMKNNEK